MSKRSEKIFLVTMCTLMSIGAIYSIGRAIFVIATAQAEYGITSDVVGNNPFASIILAIVAISVIFVNIEFYKSQEKLEEIVTKLNNKDKREKSSSDILEQEGEILIYNDIEEK